jgi:hypothetical protein
MAGSVGVAALLPPHNMLPERYAAVHFPAIVLEGRLRRLPRAFSTTDAFCTAADPFSKLLINSKPALIHIPQKITKQPHYPFLLFVRMLLDAELFSL